MWLAPASTLKPTGWPGPGPLPDGHRVPRLARLAPPALLACLALAFFADLVFHPSEILYSDYSDLVTLHLPAKRFLVRSWRETGAVPLWCPYNLGGVPFVHDVQSSAFYPPHAVLYILPEERIGPALSWLIVAHVMAAGWCMYVYGRGRGLGRLAAFVAALGYMFAGKWLLHLLGGGHYNMVPLAWLPLVLLCLERAIQRRSLPWATAGGAVFSLLVLGAYPYVTLYAGLFVAGWTLAVVLGDGGVAAVSAAGPSLAWWFLTGAWAAVVAVALGAVQLLPGLEAVRQSSRGLGVPASWESLADGARSLAGLVGPPLTSGPDWLWENRVGLGLVWLGTAAVAPLLCGRRVRVPLAACAGLALFALGGAVLLQGLPGFRLFQLPSRALLLLTFPVSLLAGEVTETLFSAAGPDVTTRRQAQRRFVRVVQIGLASLASLAVVLALKKERLHPSPYWLSLAVTLPAAWWTLGQPPTAFGRAAWIAALLADLWAIGQPMVRVRPEAEIFRPSSCVGRLMNQPPASGRVWDVNPQGASANCTPLWPGAPMAWGIEPVRGFNPVDVLRYKQYLRLVADDDRPLRPLDRLFTSAVLGTFPVRNQALADLLGVRYLLQPAGLPLEATVPAAARDQWRRMCEDAAPLAFNFIPAHASGDDAGLKTLGPYALYENLGALPRAFIVPDAAPLPAPDRLSAVFRSTDFRRTVYLEDATPQGSISQAPCRSARVREYLPNRVVIEVGEPSVSDRGTPEHGPPAAGAPGSESNASGTGGGAYLVLADPWYPGWKCSIDGLPTPVYRADFLFRAVRLPANCHTVVFTFAPDSYAAGRGVSLAGLVVIAGVGLGGFVRRRR